MIEVAAGDTTACSTPSRRARAMEQDRAPTVLVHHDELAWTPLDQSRGNCQPDCRHQNSSGLAVRAELDSAEYPKGQVVCDEGFAAIKIERNEFHGDWNYCIRSGVN